MTELDFHDVEPLLIKIIDRASMLPGEDKTLKAHLAIVEVLGENGFTGEISIHELVVKRVIHALFYEEEEFGNQSGI